MDSHFDEPLPLAHIDSEFQLEPVAHVKKGNIATAIRLFQKRNILRIAEEGSEESVLDVFLQPECGSYTLSLATNEYHQILATAYTSRDDIKKVLLMINDDIDGIFEMPFNAKLSHVEKGTSQQETISHVAHTSKMPIPLHLSELKIESWYE